VLRDLGCGTARDRDVSVAHGGQGGRLMDSNYVRITSSCGVDQTVHERAIEWITGRHAHAHQKGTGGLSAGGCQVEIDRVAQPVKDREAGE
jgi:hypothetical protein